MTWIYLSPHLDDVALSCGGLAWQQAQAGEQVNLWTMCAGDPPAVPLSPFAESLHRRWQMDRAAAAIRRQEDILSCARLGAVYQHFLLPDCIYRQAGAPPVYLYASEQVIFGPLDPAESGLVAHLSQELARLLPARSDVVIPLALGGHVDHRLTRAAAEGAVCSDMRLWYYADYPYALSAAAELRKLQQAGWQTVAFEISPAGLAAWQSAIAAHASQISTFWSGLEAMQSAIRDYCQELGGAQLWKRPD